MMTPPHKKVAQHHREQVRDAAEASEHPDMSVSEIADATGLTRGRVRRTATDLVERGDLEVTRCIGSAKMYALAGGEGE